LATLYVVEPGCRLEREGRRLLVTQSGDVLRAVPLGRLSQVVLIGSVGSTTQALQMLLRAEIPLCLISRSGKLLGRLTPPMGKNLPLRHAHYRRAQDPAFCLRVAKRIADAKLRNARTVARRIIAVHPEIGDGPLERMDDALRAIPKAEDLGQVRGWEGLAGRAYFSAYKRALPPDMTFKRRNRRPPRDPVNALLSLGYTLLTQNMITACEVVGLDPYDGFLHGDKYGRPALALDLVEPFRAIVVDLVVKRLVNRRSVKPRDFTTHGQGVYLSQRAMKRFLRAYTARLETTVTDWRSGVRLSYQKHFELETRKLARAIQGSLDSYQPLRIR